MRSNTKYSNTSTFAMLTGVVTDQTDLARTTETFEKL